MFNDEDDPLSSSIFDIPNTSSILGPPQYNPNRSLETSFYSPHYEGDLWGSSSRFDPLVDAPWTLDSGSNNLTNGSNHAFDSFSAPVDNHFTSITAASALSGAKLPDIYNTMYIQAQHLGRVSLPSLRRVLESGHLAGAHVEKIVRMVVPDGVTYVTQPEFNTALALLACAQNKMDVSLENVYQNRHFLPEPVLYTNAPKVDQNHQQHRPDPLKLASHQENTTTSRLQGSENPKVNGTYPGMTASAKTDSSLADDASPKNHPVKSLDTRSWFHKVEEIKVTIAPEREGFIFKHVNYIVESQKRSSIVLRRYSDFWWLMEVLSRRYPFRILPNLPPKKVAGTSHHHRLEDSAFLERRRKGLSRFINALVRHPVLRNDEVVTRFLTEPSELASWRKQNPPSLDEEYRRKQFNIQELQLMIPENFDKQLRDARHRVDAAIENYINLCFIMERMIRRMHGQATDYARYSITLNSLAEKEHRYHAIDCRHCQQVVKGYENVAKHMQRGSTILENQVTVAADGVLENLKRFRDLLVSYRELEERRNKLAGNQMEAFSKRISANRAKVNQHKGVPGMEAEVSRLEEAIRADERELHDQQRRQIFIRFCMWSELIYLHKQQAFVSSLYQSFVKDMTHFSQKQTDNWKQLQDLLTDMPNEPALFQ